MRGKVGHHLAIDLGQDEIVSGLTYLPRGSNINGRIKSYRISVSKDGQTWTEAATGTFPNKIAPHTARFPKPVETRHIRLEALDSHNGPWATAAEISPVLVK